MLDLIKPEKLNWKHYFGSFVLLLLIVQFFTGTILTLFYEPTLKDAYLSVQYITNQLWGGSLTRNGHRWIALVIFAAALVHTIRSTLRKDFMNTSKRVAWLTGVLLIWPLFLLLYTGLVLPWEWKGYWFMEMIATYAAQIPVMGPDLKAFFLMTFTLPRYLVVHILVLPLICLVLVDYHFLGKLRRRGIFRHILRHTLVALPLIAAVVALSIYITIPSNDPNEIPLPLEGAEMPTPEWIALTLLLPFRSYKGTMVAFLAVYIPAVLLFGIAFMPYYLKGKKEAEAEGALNNDLAEGAADPPSDRQKKASKGTGANILRGVIVTVIVGIFLGLLFLGNHLSPTFGCNSCHNLSRGMRMGVPPETFRDRKTLPNLDDDKWMLGHWYYPNEIF